MQIGSTESQRAQEHTHNLGGSLDLMIARAPEHFGKKKRELARFQTLCAELREYFVVLGVKEFDEITMELLEKKGYDLKIADKKTDLYFEFMRLWETKEMCVARRDQEIDVKEYLKITAGVRYTEVDGELVVICLKGSEYKLLYEDSERNRVLDLPEYSMLRRPLVCNGKIYFIGYNHEGGQCVVSEDGVVLGNKKGYEYVGDGIAHEGRTYVPVRKGELEWSLLIDNKEFYNFTGQISDIVLLDGNIYFQVKVDQDSGARALCKNGQIVESPEEYTTIERISAVDNELLIAARTSEGVFILDENWKKLAGPFRDTSPVMSFEKLADKFCILFSSKKVYEGAGEEVETTALLIRAMIKIGGDICFMAALGIKEYAIIDRDDKAISETFSNTFTASEEGDGSFSVIGILDGKLVKKYYPIPQN